MKYLPFLNGTYTVAPALLAARKMDNAIYKNVFQIDESYKQYLANKQACREEGISKYYVEKRASPGTVAQVNQLIVQQLLEEYPAHFYLKQEDDNYILI